MLCRHLHQRRDPGTDAGHRSWSCRREPACGTRQRACAREPRAQASAESNGAPGYLTGWITATSVRPPHWRLVVLIRKRHAAPASARDTDSHLMLPAAGTTIILAWNCVRSSARTTSWRIYRRADAAPPAPASREGNSLRCCHGAVLKTKMVRERFIRHFAVSAARPDAGGAGEFLRANACAARRWWFMRCVRAGHFIAGAQRRRSPLEFGSRPNAGRIISVLSASTVKVLHQRKSEKALLP